MQNKFKSVPVKSSEITPYSEYLSRRDFLKAAGIVTGSALLAACAPDVVPIDTIEDLLWPDGAPSANALQALVSKLRKVVAPGIISPEGLGYALRGVETDLARFGELVAAGRHADAESLVRGRPLDDLGDAPVALPLRARLDGDVDAARGDRLEASVRVDPRGALGELRALVAEQLLVFGAAVEVAAAPQEQRLVDDRFQMAV